MCSSQTQLKGINYKAERLRLHTWPYVHACMLSRFICVQLFATPWTVAHQAPLSVGLSRREYCSGLPYSSPGDLPQSGIEPRSLALQADSLPSEPPGKPLQTGGPWNKPNTDSEPGKARWLAKGNPEEMPHERDLNYQEVVNTGCFLSSIFRINKIWLLYSYT